MHIYAFGSLCRGEIDFGSDVDLLAVTDGFDRRFDPNKFSIYSYKRLEELWKQGNPFAWHLSLESKLIFSSDNIDWLTSLGSPNSYSQCADDCLKFARLYERALTELRAGGSNLIFELSNVFLAVRNFATCFALGVMKVPNFSRDSARRLGDRSIEISDRAFELLERCRILSTRAVGPIVKQADFETCFEEIAQISSWMKRLLAEVSANG